MPLRTVGLSLALVAMVGPAYAELLTIHRIPASLAHEAVGAAVAACRTQGFAVTAAFVDGAGLMQASLRGDGAGTQTAESAWRKAHTSALFATDSGAMADAKAAGKPYSPLPDRLDDLIVAKGGVVIKVNDEVVGAIGVGGAPGSDLDEGCAKAGLAAIRARLN